MAWGHPNPCNIKPGFIEKKYIRKVHEKGISGEQVANTTEKMHPYFVNGQN